MGLSMCTPTVASFSIRESNGTDLIEVPEMDKNVFHRTVPGATGRWQVSQDVATGRPMWAAPIWAQAHMGPGPWGLGLGSLCFDKSKSTNRRPGKYDLPNMCFMLFR